MQVCKPCHYKAVEPFKLFPISMSYIYVVFEHLIRLWMGIWLHIHTITTTEVSSDLWELGEFFLMQVCKPCHYGLVEAKDLWHTYMRDLITFSGYGWAYGLTLTLLPPQMLPQIWESWLKSYLMQVWKPCHYALFEAVKPWKLHPISMA